MSVTIIIALVLILLAGSVIQGTIGFGLGTVATPIIALFAPHLLPTLILVLAFVIASTTLVSNLRHHADADFSLIGVSSIARLPGSFLAAWILTRVDVTVVQIFIAVAVILAMSLSGLGWSPQPSLRNTAIAGFSSGFLGTSTSVGGPPMALVLKRFNPDKVRGTLAGTFVIGSLISLTMLLATGAATFHDIAVAAAFLPVAALGLFISSRINKYVNSAMLNRMVITIAVSASVVLLFQALFRLLQG